jgi:hypothetical protein
MQRGTGRPFDGKTHRGKPGRVKGQRNRWRKADLLEAASRPRPGLVGVRRSAARPRAEAAGAGAEAGTNIVVSWVKPEPEQGSAAPTPQSVGKRTAG